MWGVLFKTISSNIYILIRLTMGWSNWGLDIVKFKKSYSYILWEDRQLQVGRNIYIKLKT